MSSATNCRAGSALTGSARPDCAAPGRSSGLIATSTRVPGGIDGPIWRRAATSPRTAPPPTDRRSHRGRPRLETAIRADDVIGHDRKRRTAVGRTTTPDSAITINVQSHRDRETQSFLSSKRALRVLRASVATVRDRHRAVFAHPANPSPRMSIGCARIHSAAAARQTTTSDPRQRRTGRPAPDSRARRTWNEAASDPIAPSRMKPT